MKRSEQRHGARVQSDRANKFYSSVNERVIARWYVGINNRQQLTVPTRPPRNARY